MSIIVTGYDPNDWKDLVSKGKTLACDYCLFMIPHTVTVEKTGEMPAGWIILRESFFLYPGQYSLTIVCPECSAAEQAYYARKASEYANH